MARKTIEYRGEFKVKLDFVMTSGEGVDDFTVKEAVKELDENMFECILEALNSYFDDGEDSLQHLKITCEDVDHVINVADNTSEVEMISEKLKTESGEE